MKFSGKYKVTIDNGFEKRFVETSNHVVKNGIRQISDWLKYDLYSNNSFPFLKRIDNFSLSEEESSMYYKESAFDYSIYDESNIYYDSENNIDIPFYDFEKIGFSEKTYATIDANRTGEQRLTINFDRGAEMLAAINLDARMFHDVNDNITFKIEYRTVNDITWKSIPCNYTLVPDGIRRNVTFFVCKEVPPFVFVPCTALRFTFETEVKDDNKSSLIGEIYNISLFSPNTLPQPPMVMKFGTGKTEVEYEQNSLENEVYSQVVSYTKKLDNTITYIVDIPKDKCNDIDIYEIGMFFRYDNVNPSQQHVKQTVKNANTMFSRAIFKNENGEPISWIKNSNENISIAYELTIENDFSIEKEESSFDTENSNESNLEFESNFLEKSEFTN